MNHIYCATQASLKCHTLQNGTCAAREHDKRH